MKKLTGKFTIIPNKYINDSAIDAFEFRIMCYLCKLADNNNSCYPSYETIARETNISITKVKRAVKSLIEKGYISCQSRRKKDGSSASNIYVVSETTTMEDTTDTMGSVCEEQPGGICEIRGSISDDHNKYLNNNTNLYNNNHHLSIGEVLEQAEIENLTGDKYKNYKSALEIMVQAKSIRVCGQNIPQAEVHDRLKNIRYEHLAYVDNNMPRSMVNGKTEVQVINPVPYIISSLYNALQFAEQELINLQYTNVEEYRNSA